MLTKRVSLFDAVRRNHSIEHGTVTLLLEQGVRPPLAGMSNPRGFFIFGDVDTDQLADAADESLRRLRAGERELAISPYCGTNLVMSALIAGIATALVFGRSRRKLLRIPIALSAVFVSMSLGRPIGSIVQRKFTTLADVGGTEITGITRLAPLGRYSLHLVRTEEAAS